MNTSDWSEAKGWAATAFAVAIMFIGVAFSVKPLTSEGEVEAQKTEAVEQIRVSDLTQIQKLEAIKAVYGRTSCHR